MKFASQYILLLVVIALTTMVNFSENAHSQGAQSQRVIERPTAFWPQDIEHSDEITTPLEFFGFRIGQRHLDHAQLVAYLEKIASESERIQIQRYGRTHGGRPLVLLTASSKENLNNLNAIRRQHRLLADPERSSTVQLEELPAVINMGYGVHGDEASATNCAALVAHYLAAAKGKQIDSWLDQCVVLLDPCLNPDGFNRFANWVNDHRGRILNPDGQHREHNQSWPSGRVNYYWFDLNRDWLPLEHPESRARMRWYHSWKPNVVLDFHEMGSESTYFFQPGVPLRVNPLTPLKNLELTSDFARYHAQALDSRGSLYFTKELFDDFYMGKGSTYPDLHGAVGILFEQASARGHVQENQDGLLRFHDAIANHFSTSLSSLKATSSMRMELLNYKRSFYDQSIASADKKKIVAYAFTCENNPARLQRFAQTMMRHDIRCYQPKQAGAIGGIALKESTVVVPLKQPEYRFLQSLMMRRKKFKENIFYDVSSWTLPLAYGLKQTNLKEKLDFDLLERISNQGVKATKFAPDEQAVAYAVDWRCDNSVNLLNELLKRDINVRVATRPFTIAGKDESGGAELEQGTLIIPLGIQNNRRQQIERLLSVAAKNHVQWHPMYGGLSVAGPDLGSNRFRKVSKPKVLMAVGQGVSQYGAGEIWHLLDVKHSMQITMSDYPGRVDLRPYTTIVFPPGRYSSLTRKDWDAVAMQIKNGATAIAIGSSCDLIHKKLTATSGGDDEKTEQLNNSDDENPEAKVQLPLNSASRTRALQLISGAILQTKIDRTHPLFYGFPEDSLAVFRNHAKFLKPSDNPYSNPGIYDSDRPHLAGYCSKENIEQIRKAASVVVTPLGKGRLIQISDSPNFRAFWHGTSRVFLNAVFFGEFTNPPTPRNENEE